MRKKQFIRVIAATGVAAVVAVVALFFLSTTDPSFRRVAFVQSNWLSGDIRLRGQMVDDLMKCKLLDGKAQSEVLQLLGQPNFTGPDSMSYTVDIGFRFCFGRWPYQLAIRLDQSARVKEYYLMD